MKNRREFLQATATGALLLGSQSKLGLAGMFDHKATHTETGKSRVVIARDPALHGPDGQLDEKRVLDLLDRAIAPTRAATILSTPGSTLCPPAKSSASKPTASAAKASQPTLLVMAVAERLQQAGVKPGEIIVWDRNRRDLEACGLTINTDPSKMRCYGSDVSGFEDTPEQWGTAACRSRRS
jgi:hypothetical protein